MNSKIKLLGKTFPTGLLITALVVASAGAAVGTVLSGKVSGEMPVAVSQALLVGTPAVGAYDLATNTPVAASGDKDDSDIAETPTTWANYPDAIILSDITTSDDVWAKTTTTVALTKRAEQVFKFYMGSTGTSAELLWEGHGNNLFPVRLTIWNNTTLSWTTVSSFIDDGNDTTVSATVTRGTDFDVDSGGYAYVQFLNTDTALGSFVWTDYLSLTAVDDNIPQNVENGCGLTSSAPDRFAGVASDDHTAFQAAAEVDTGDCFVIKLPLKNASNQDLVGTVTLNVPDDLTAEVFKQAGSTNIGSVVRTGSNSWKFNLLAGALYDPATDSLYVIVASEDDDPGYYTVSGTLSQISY